MVPTFVQGPPSGQLYHAVQTADFNNDEHVDLIAYTQGTLDGPVVRVVLGDGSGRFLSESITQLAPLTTYLNPFRAADLNGDSIPDLVSIIAAPGTQAAIPGYLELRLGNGDGSFGMASVLDAGIQPGTRSEPDIVLAADITGDGRNDLVVAKGRHGFRTGDIFDHNYLAIHDGLPDGTLAPARNIASHVVTDPFTGLGIGELVLGDVNGDGCIDIVTPSMEVYGFQTFLNNSDGTFSVVHHAISEMRRGFVHVGGDVNGDGFLDLIAGLDGDPNVVVVRLGIGDGSFQPARYSSIGENHDIPPTGPENPGGGASVNIGPISMADVNGDGRLDLLVPNAVAESDISYGTRYSHNYVSVLLGNGDGSFQAPQIYASGGPGPQSVAIADFDEDGRLDAAVAHMGNGRVSMLRNVGNNVTARVTGTTLTLTDDDVGRRNAEGTRLRIEAVGDQIRVMPAAGTDLNGQRDPLLFAGIERVNISTADADDSIVVGSLNLPGGLRFTARGGDDELILEGDHVLGPLTYSGGHGDNLFSAGSGVNTFGEVTIRHGNGAGAAQFGLAPTDQTTIVGNLSITHGRNDGDRPTTFSAIGSRFEVQKKLTFVGAAGTRPNQVELLADTTIVRGAVSITTAGGDDRVVLTGTFDSKVTLSTQAGGDAVGVGHELAGHTARATQIAGALAISLGSAAAIGDQVDIDDLTLLGTANIRGSGATRIRIETLDSGAKSEFRHRVTFALGSGDDTIDIGRNVDLDDGARFLKAFQAYGGKGTNLLSAFDPTCGNQFDLTPRIRDFTVS